MKASKSENALVGRVVEVIERVIVVVWSGAIPHCFSKRFLQAQTVRSPLLLAKT